MKNYLAAALLTISIPCFAFQDYEAVSCNSNMKGLKMHIEYDRSSAMLTIESRGESGQIAATEKGQRIIVEPQDDGKGGLIGLELWSNEDNWQAILSMVKDKKLTLSLPFTCHRIKASSVKQSSHGFGKLAAKLIG